MSGLLAGCLSLLQETRYLAVITTSQGKVFALFVKSPTRVSPCETSLASVTRLACLTSMARVVRCA